MNRKKPKVLFRVDASHHIGSGHVMRCLALASELREKNVASHFIMKELQGNLIDVVKKKGFTVKQIPCGMDIGDKTHNRLAYADWLGGGWAADAEDTKNIVRSENLDIDWLIIDHYALDIRWEKQMRSYVKRIMVIDDLADRSHDCDLILDQNYYQNPEYRYQNLISDQCKRLFGPDYVLLRHEFRQERGKLRKRDGCVKRMFVFFGGYDSTCETAKVLTALKSLDMPDIAVDVVVGSENHNKSHIENFCRSFPQATYYCQVDNIAELMAVADLAIGAGGTTTWERCCMGLPSVVITTAFNQIQPIKELADNNILCYLGESEKVAHHDIIGIFRHLSGNPEILRRYSQNSKELVDGIGCQRGADKLLLSHCESVN
jgi:UDP-2,4-diacetamido-2,4,6-trideoxy-beta-L-altropyranose hydrolase